MDYEHGSIAEADSRAGGGHLYFITADAAALPIVNVFEFAMCLTNTWGTMSDKPAVLRGMRRLAPTPHSRLLEVSEAWVPSRREWYRRLGHAVAEETPECLATKGGAIRAFLRGSPAEPRRRLNHSPAR